MSDCGPRWASWNRGEEPEDAVEFCTSGRGVELVARARDSNGELVLCTYIKQYKTTSPLTKRENAGDGEQKKSNNKLTYYRLLCGAQETWERTNSSDPLPEGALPAGFSDDLGVLYIGRFRAFNTWIAGKVSSRTRQCYGYFKGKEYVRDDYEIMLVPDEHYFELLSDEITNALSSEQSTPDEPNKSTPRRKYNRRENNKGPNQRGRGGRSNEAKNRQSWRGSQNSLQSDNSATSRNPFGSTFDVNKESYKENSQVPSRWERVIHRQNCLNDGNSPNNIQGHQVGEKFFSEELFKYLGDVPIKPQRQSTQSATISEQGIPKLVEVSTPFFSSRSNTWVSANPPSIEPEPSESEEESDDDNGTYFDIFPINADLGVPSLCWVDAKGGEVPLEALVVGKSKGRKVYVARAKEDEQLVPGYLLEGEKRCWICWNNDDGFLRKSKYQVLCDNNAIWVDFNNKYETSIPKTAVLGGYDDSESPVYIGRVKHAASQIVGKVPLTRTDGNFECSVVVKGVEFCYDKFELLKYPPHAYTNAMRANLPRTMPRSSRNASNKTEKVDVQKLEVLPLTDFRAKVIIDKMQATIVSHLGNRGGIFTSYEIIKVERIINTSLYREYEHRRERVAARNGGDANELQLFHGSKFAQHIAEHGFDESHSNQGGMFGAGIYFAEHSSKSNQYTWGMGGGCPYHQDPRCTYCTRLMLVCRVTLGKMKEHTSGERYSHAPPTYHSVKGVPTYNGLAYPEYIIYRGEQAFPDYLITYRIK